MKKKIHNYDFLVVGSGLIGSLAAIVLLKKNYNVLVVDKKSNNIKDNRTLAVNANSRDLLIELGLWKRLQSKSEPINKIEITDKNHKKPIIFENSDESMGSVILNRELLENAKKYLKQKKVLIENIDLNLSHIIFTKKISIDKDIYSFKHILMSIGKNFQNEKIFKKYSFKNNHKSYVGFFSHKKKHYQTAYEVFTPRGPLAVLPAPHRSKTLSTFIYSTKDNLTLTQINYLIKDHFFSSHGKITIDKKNFKYEIIPHFTKDIYKQVFLIGDTLRSIHPVAGQGWNLGIKDIQTIINLLENHQLSDPNLIKKYYDKRNLESIGYLAFTSILNSLYENNNSFTTLLTKIGFNLLKVASPLRNTFIKQAMGRINLI